MTITLEQLELWMQSDENAHLEFKEARESYTFDKLKRYCVALSNEGGGYLVLGVTDRLPRQVVGTNAFLKPTQTVHDVLDKLHFRVDCDEIEHPNGRVLVFSVPSRPMGVPIALDGQYLMRSGESSVPMSQDMLKRIFDEAIPDYSAQICAKASFADLDADAIDTFRQLWIRKSQNQSLHESTVGQLLSDAELVVDDGITYAALVLLGTKTSLGKYLPQSEVIFEYHSSEASLEYQQRYNYREAFFLFYDKLWDTLNLRNDIQHFNEGFFVRDIPTFNEEVVREAILNAVTHRDYSSPASVFIRQLPRSLTITSPGGLPRGVTVSDIMYRHIPRNRRIAETCEKCGLVERSGQGVDRMFRESIKQSKPVPDFIGTDDYQVCLTLRGDIQDVAFLRFLENVGAQRQVTFTTEDFMVLDLLHRELPVSHENLKIRIKPLLNLGVIEFVGRGRGVKYLLSRSFYDHIGKQGSYTRRRGLDRNTNKQLLLEHIRSRGELGCQLKELMQVLPANTMGQVQSLLKELRADNQIICQGNTSAARWYHSSYRLTANDTGTNT